VITIKIPALWRPITGTSHVSLQAETVSAALQALVNCYPQLHAQLFNDRQEVNEGLNLFLNDEHIRYRGGLDAPLHDGDELYIVPLITGG
jgi:adenylyltransferase/sulfurtransferase